jgi:hypothetical protein
MLMVPVGLSSVPILRHSALSPAQRAFESPAVTMTVISTPCDDLEVSLKEFMEAEVIMPMVFPLS